MKKGATNEVPPSARPTSDLPRPRHSTAARLVASVRATRADLVDALRPAVDCTGIASSHVGLGAALGLAGIMSQDAKKGLVAAPIGLGASSGVAGDVSEESNAGMASATAQASKVVAGQASQVIERDNKHCDFLGGLDSTQNLETTNKKRNKDDCTPKASRRQSLEISSNTKGKQSKSNFGPSKRSTSGSNHPEARAIVSSPATMAPSSDDINYNVTQPTPHDVVQGPEAECGPRRCTRVRKRSTRAQGPEWA